MSNIQCFCCQKFGHYNQCTKRKDDKKRKGKQHGSAAIDDDEHPYQKKFKNENEEDLVFFPALSGIVADNSDICLVDNGASKQMTANHSSLTKLVEEGSALKVELGDNGKYEFKGVGSTPFQLELGGNIYLNDVFYVP